MLFDPKTEQRAKRRHTRLAKHLEKAIDLIEHGGWCKGELHQDIGGDRISYCLVGAVNAACGRSVGKNECYAALAAQIPATFWPDKGLPRDANVKWQVITYNDHAHTGCADMLNLIHRAHEAATAQATLL